MLQPFLGTTGDENKSWRTSTEQTVKWGWGGWDVLLREELDAEVTYWGDKWTRWQTASVVPKGRRGNSAPLIMRWPSPRKLLLHLPSETLPVSALWDAAPQAWQKDVQMHFQSEYKSILYICPKFLFIIIIILFYYFLLDIFCLNFPRVMYSTWRCSSSG